MDEETETQDFMNVESFSQLPFTRRPSKDNKNPKPIRLFGKDFTGQEDYSDSSKSKNKEDQEQEQEQEQEHEEQEDQTGKDSNISSSNNRRFECHYCFRNFPTSQALGGHQNAHKRERQLAKRGASSYFHHPDPNLFGYRHYPSWTSGPLPGSRFYGGHTNSGPPYYTRPINGSPLGSSSSSQWRVPPSSSSSFQGVYNSNAAFTSHPHSTSPFLASSHQPHPPSQVRGSAAQNRMSTYRYGLGSNVQDHVSLDLHL